jgi:hypothetical protein
MEGLLLPAGGAVVQEAGLCQLGMIGVQPHFGPGDEVGLAYLVESLRVAAPLIVGTGVATTEEIGMETFEQRVREETEKTQPGPLAHLRTTSPRIIPCISCRVSFVG